MSTTIKQQILRAQDEAKTSLDNARSLYDQWLVSSGSNPTGLTQKEIDHIAKAFKNRLLTLKWDCEDLEELVNVNEKNISKTPNISDCIQEIDDAKAFIQECRTQLTFFNHQLEDFDSNRRLFNKHGIQMAELGKNHVRETKELTKTLQNNTNVAQSIASAVVTSIIENPLQNHEIQYERLNNGRILNKINADKTESAIQEEERACNVEDLGPEIEHFDKSRIETSTTIFNNALFEHYEYENDPLRNKNVNASKVFGNLSRPQNGEIYMDSNNDNEMILEMLETEYYNPPPGFLSKTSAVTKRYNQAIRNLLPKKLGQNKYVAAVSLFILILLYIVII